MALVNTFQRLRCLFFLYLFTVLKIINIKSMKKGRISGFLLAYDLGPPLSTLLAIIGEKMKGEVLLYEVAQNFKLKIHDQNSKNQRPIAVDVLT
jgi:hypothetical protein